MQSRPRNQLHTQKMSNSMDINMVRRAGGKNSHDSSSQVLKIIAKATKTDLPWNNQRLPGPVDPDKQCNAWPLPGSGGFGRDYCPHCIH